MNWNLEEIRKYLGRRMPTVDAVGAQPAPEAAATPLDRIKQYLQARGLLQQAGAGEDAAMRAEMNSTLTERDLEQGQRNIDDMTDSSHFVYGRGATPWKTERHSADRRAEAQQQIRDYLLKKRGQDDSLITKAFDDKPDNGAYNMAELERRKAQDLAREKQGAQWLELRGRELDRKERDIARKANAPPKAPKGAADPSGLPFGWELDPASHATKMQNEKFEGLVYADNEMRGLTAEMRKLLAAAGAGRLVPGSNARIKQLATEIKIAGKNVAALGALSGPDMSLMDAIAGDPTKLGSLARDTGALLDGLDHWGRNSVEAKAKGLGATRKASPSGEAAGGGLVEVEDPENPGLMIHLSPAAAGKLRGK